MTQLQPHKDIYAIEVSLGACDFTIENDNGSFLVYKIHKDLPDKSCKSLPEGNWQILGEVTKDHISPKVLGIVKLKGMVAASIAIMRGAAKQEVYTLLAANGLYFENPILIDKKHISNNIDSLIEEWQSYEDKLVEKLLIVKKL